MKDIVEETINLINEEYRLEEMANIQPRTTGLKTQLYSTFNGVEEKIPHGPRVKVKTKNSGRFPIILPEAEPVNDQGQYDDLKNEDKVLVDEAIKYIKKNKEIFLAHWNGKIGDEQLRKVLKGEFTLDQAILDAEQNGLE